VLSHLPAEAQRLLGAAADGERWSDIDRRHGEPDG
jgi:hypothetical protein